jgi:outer membrane protein TolC
MKNQKLLRPSISMMMATLLIMPSLTLAQNSENAFTLETYLKEVKTQNLNIIANAYSSQSFRLRVGEAGLDFMPYATGNAQYSDDKRIGSFSSALGSEAVTEAGTLGVQQKLRTGTLVGFNYNLTLNSVYNSPFYAASFGSLNYSAYTAAPEITITQPLWRDFNASLSKATEESVLAGLRAQDISNQYSNQQIISNAENAYWILSLDREVVRLDRESIERTDKILKRNQKRVSMNVADRSDLLQSLASLKTKELAFQQDIEVLRQASMKFNSLRNVSNDTVAETLQGIGEFVDTDLAKDIVRKGERADVIVAISNAEKSKADAKAADIRNQPDVEFIGTYQFDGRGSNAGTALGTSWNGDNPYLTAQLTLKIPLDFDEVSKMAAGYKAQAAAAEATTARAKFDLDQDWMDLQKHFKDAMSRLSLARDLEKLQAEKLKYERQRFASGRTTSFQVLQFEDNFSDASLSRLRVENELISMRAQARLYNGDVK